VNKQQLQLFPPNADLVDEMAPASRGVGTSDLPELIGAEEAYSIISQHEFSQIAEGLQSVINSPKHS